MPAKSQHKSRFPARLGIGAVSFHRPPECLLGFCRFGLLTEQNSKVVPGFAILRFHPYSFAKLFPLPPDTLLERKTVVRLLSSAARQGACF